MKEEGSILIQNIYYMLAYVFDSLRQKEYAFLDREPFGKAQNLYAAILSVGVQKQLKQGLYRVYQDREENLQTVRGRIQMAGTLRCRRTRTRALSCVYGELTENNLFNQILKTGLWVLIRHPEVDQRYRDALRRIYFRFASIDRLDPAAIPWSTLQFQRGNQSYRMLLGICQLLLEGMLPTTETGAFRMASFREQMEKYHLYEKFLLAYYRREWPGVRAGAPQVPCLMAHGHPRTCPREEMRLIVVGIENLG